MDWYFVLSPASLLDGCAASVYGWWGHSDNIKCELSKLSLDSWYQKGLGVLDEAKGMLCYKILNFCFTCHLYTLLHNYLHCFGVSPLVSLPSFYNCSFRMIQTADESAAICVSHNKTNGGTVSYYFLYDCRLSCYIQNPLRLTQTETSHQCLQRFTEMATLCMYILW